MISSESIPAAAAINHIERLAKDYACAREVVAERVDSLKQETDAVHRRRLPGIKLAVAVAADAQAAILAAIMERPDLFEKPRTMTLHGIKLGFQKQKGKTLWPAVEKLIAAIKRNFAPATVARLIATVEEPNKDAILQLPAHELKKLGVEIVEAGDAVVIKTSDSEIDKFVAALLKEGAVESAGESA